MEKYVELAKNYNKLIEKHNKVIKELKLYLPNEWNYEKTTITKLPSNLKDAAIILIEQYKEATTYVTTSTKLSPNLEEATLILNESTTILKEAAIKVETNTKLFEEYLLMLKNKEKPRLLDHKPESWSSPQHSQTVNFELKK